MTKKVLIAATAAFFLAGAGLRPASADGVSGGNRFMQGYTQGYEHGYVDGIGEMHEEGMEGHHGMHHGMHHGAHHGHHSLCMTEEGGGPGPDGCSCGGGYSSKKSFERLTKQLGLEGEQKEKVRAVLNDEVKKVDVLYKQVHEKELQQIQETQKRVAELLKGEQKEKWDKMMEKGIKKFRHFMEKTGLQEEEKEGQPKKQ